VQHIAHLARTKKKIRAIILPHQKAETIGMTLHPSTNEIEFLRHTDRIAPVAHDLAGALHGGKPVLERLAFRGLYVEQARKFGLGHRHALRG
jgi:hypothetical protein